MLPSKFDLSCAYHHIFRTPKNWQPTTKGQHRLSRMGQVIVRSVLNADSLLSGNAVTAGKATNSAYCSTLVANSSTLHLVGASVIAACCTRCTFHFETACKSGRSLHASCRILAFGQCCYSWQSYKFCVLLRVWYKLLCSAFGWYIHHSCMLYVSLHVFDKLRPFWLGGYNQRICKFGEVLDARRTVLPLHLYPCNRKQSTCTDIFSLEFHVSCRHLFSQPPL